MCVVSGYIVSLARRLALEVRGRRFESCYPDSTHINLSVVKLDITEDYESSVPGSSPGGGT